MRLTITELIAAQSFYAAVYNVLKFAREVECSHLNEKDVDACNAALNGIDDALRRDLCGADRSATLVSLDVARAEFSIRFLNEQRETMSLDAWVAYQVEDALMSESAVILADAIKEHVASLDGYQADAKKFLTQAEAVLRDRCETREAIAYWRNIASTWLKIPEAQLDAWAYKTVA